MANEEEKKQFYIPKIEEETTSGGSGVLLDHFASSVSGYQNKDNMTYPHLKNTKETRYDAFRSPEERQSADPNYISPEKKYDPSRIPSYLRRDEPAISRNNIDYLKDEKLDERDLYNRNREKYGRYSEQNHFGDDRGVVRSVLSQETGVKRDTPYVKPTRNERSTLVVRRSEEQNDSYQGNTYREPQYQPHYGSHSIHAIPFELHLPHLRQYILKMLMSFSTQLLIFLWFFMILELAIINFLCEDRIIVIGFGRRRLFAALGRSRIGFCFLFRSSCTHCSRLSQGN